MVYIKTDPCQCTHAGFSHLDAPFGPGRCVLCSCTLYVKAQVAPTDPIRDAQAFAPPREALFGALDQVRDGVLYCGHGRQKSICGECFPPETVTSGGQVHRGRRGEGAGREVPNERRDPPEKEQQPFYRPFGKVAEGVDLSHHTFEPRKTLGIPPATEGPLQVLQFAKKNMDRILHEAEDTRVRQAAHDISVYRTDDQELRYLALGQGLEMMLMAIVDNAPPGPERSTAISRAREAKFWAAAGIALEKA